MPQPIKIQEVRLKAVDLTLFESKTLRFGFPVDPPQFVYHPAAFTEVGTWFIHPQRYDDPNEAAHFLAATKEAGEIDIEIWLPLIEFNLHLGSGEKYEDFLAKTTCRA